MTGAWQPRGAGRAGWLRSYPLTLGLAALVLALAFSSLAMVRAGEVGVVLRLGQPVRLAGPGLDWHWPLAERMVRVDLRSQPLALERLAAATVDGRRLEVDALVRLEVVDPLRLVRAAATSEAAEARLRGAFAPVLGAALAQRSAPQWLTADGAGLLAPVVPQLDARARELGARVRGVELTRVSLASGNEGEAQLARMADRLKDEAQVVRERGQGQASLRQAEAQRAAAAITDRAFAQDVEFYDFWRAMRSYKTQLGGPDDKGGTTIVIGPDSEYLRQFRGGGSAR